MYNFRKCVYCGARLRFDDMSTDFYCESSNDHTFCLIDGNVNLSFSFNNKYYEFYFENDKWFSFRYSTIVGDINSTISELISTHNLLELFS